MWPGRTEQSHTHMEHLRGEWAADPQRFQSEYEGYNLASSANKWADYVDASTPSQILSSSARGGFRDDYSIGHDYWKDSQP